MARRDRLRWWELAPEGLLAVGLGLFLITEPDAATSAFHSRRALALMAAVGLGWLVLRVLLARLDRGWRAVRTGAFGVGAVAILAVVVLPAYDDTTVVETLAVEQPPSSDPVPAPPDANEAAPPTSTTAPAPVEVARGDLHGIDHRAQGTVRIYRQPSGALVVGLEDIDIQPGPDYDIYVVPGAGREDKDDGVRLDDLRGNKGTQYYDVPAGADLTPGAWTVLVWCQTFAVPVAAATPM